MGKIKETQFPKVVNSPHTHLLTTVPCHSPPSVSRSPSTCIM